MKAYRPASDVAVEHGGDTVYIARLPDGPIIALTGTAAVIWSEACSLAPRPLADRVADHVDRDAAEIAPDVERFVADLVVYGLLQEAA